jgi:ABC-type uncharacterized transport system substrate-binding protein
LRRIEIVKKSLAQGGG